MSKAAAIVGGTMVFLALQLVLFAGYHFNIIQLEEEADIEQELQKQLRGLVEEDHVLKSQAQAAHVQVATERARRSGLQLQLLRAGIKPHDMHLTGPKAAAGIEKELEQRLEFVDKALEGQLHVITGSFLRGESLASGSAPQDSHQDALSAAELAKASAAAQSQSAAGKGHNRADQQPIPEAAQQHKAGQNQQGQLDISNVKPLPATARIFPPSNEDGGCPVMADERRSEVVAGVVVVAFNRPQYLERSLSSISTAVKRKPEWSKRFPLYVSQDGQDPNVKAVIQRHNDFKHINHVETTAPKPLNRQENLAYYRISNHYKFILGTMFDCLGYKKAIILEDDMHLSLDFFEYFEAAAPLMDTDKTIYAVSSWNDHGQSQFVANSSALYRSDFFPGLGWMLTRDLWQELKPKWPRAYWDDWMRQSEHRKGRQSIRPEVCRTFNFGEQGASKGQFYKKYLATIHLNSEYVPFTTMDLQYLRKDLYSRQWNSLLESAPTMDMKHAMQATGAVKVEYSSQEEYETLTGTLGMLREWKDGVPRGAYEGAVPVRYQRAHIFIVPKRGFKAEERITGRVDANGALVKTKQKP